MLMVDEARNDDMTTSISVEELIESKLEEIDRGVDVLQQERERLQRALRELRGGSPATKTTQAASETTNGRASRQRRKPKRASSRRAPRGSNQQAIVDHVSKNPGATAGTISAATGIDRTIVYSALGRLSASGKLRREQQSDRQVAYHLADEAST